MNEREAIARMQRGDVSGLAELVAQHQVKAVRTAMLITRDRALAEDVVQGAFLRAFQKIDQFDRSKPFLPWFLRSVVNASISVARQRERTISLETPIADELTFEDLLQSQESEPAQAMEMAEQKAHIRHALDQLSPEQRAAVVMRYFLDMSENEMADELQQPAGTIKWRLHSARKRLKGLLEGVLSWEVGHG